MKISYSCLIVAVVIGLGTVTAAPADDAKAVAADAAKFTDREAADEGRQMAVLCNPGFCEYCRKCTNECWNCKACKDYCFGDPKSQAETEMTRHNE